MSIRVIHESGMTNIDHPSISYGNVRRMYQGGRDGFGLQLDERQEPKRAEITNLCHEIADKMRELEEVFKNEN